MASTTGRLVIAKARCISLSHDVSSRTERIPPDARYVQARMYHSELLFGFTGTFRFSVERVFDMNRSIAQHASFI